MNGGRLTRKLLVAAALCAITGVGLGCANGGGDFGSYEPDVAGDGVGDDVTGETSVSDAIDGAIDSTSSEVIATDGSGGDGASDVSDGTLGDASDSADSISGETTSESGGADTGTADTGSVDTTSADTGTADTGVTDSGGTDTGTIDSGTIDSGDTGVTGGCSRQADCAGTLKCGGPTICGTAVCFACGTASGASTGYTACTDSSTCATGVCDGLRKHCSASCASGSTGDGDCTTAMGGGFACTEVSYTSGTATGTLGFCAKKCARNGDCGTGDVCQGATNNGFNRLDLVCGPPAATALGIGSTCTTGADCTSRVCLSSKCTLFCATAADCSGTMPKCGTILFTLPKGGTQAANACTP